MMKPATRVCGHGGTLRANKARDGIRIQGTPWTDIIKVMARGYDDYSAERH